MHFKEKNADDNDGDDDGDDGGDEGKSEDDGSSRCVTDRNAEEEEVRTVEDERAASVDAVDTAALCVCV